MKHYIASFAFVAAMVSAALAYDGDMDTYHQFKEELALVRDSYVSSLNMAMSDANEAEPEGWFKARDNGEAEDWDDIEYEPPLPGNIPHLVLEEIPYGFHLTGKHGPYKFDAKIRVVTRDNDIFYDITYNKGSNAAAKEVVNEVFHNDRVVFYDNNTPCKRASVTCIHEYAKGTLGKSRNK